MYVFSFFAYHVFIYIQKSFWSAGSTRISSSWYLKRWFPVNVLQLYSQLESLRKLPDWHKRVSRYVYFNAANDVLEYVCTTAYLSLASVIINRWRAQWFLFGKWLTVLMCLVMDALLTWSCELVDSALNIIFGLLHDRVIFSFIKNVFFKSAIDSFIFLRTFLQLAHLIFMKYYMF